MSILQYLRVKISVLSIRLIANYNCEDISTGTDGKCISIRTLTEERLRSVTVRVTMSMIALAIRQTPVIRALFVHIFQALHFSI